MEEHNEYAEYAAWQWNEHLNNSSLKYNIFEPHSYRDGMELLSVTLMKKKKMLGHFSIAVANIRLGLRTVELHNCTNGQLLVGPGGRSASMLMDVKLVRRKEEEMFNMTKGSSSNCLKLSR